MNHAARDVIPFSFDLSSLAPRTIASLYSHLVTRPTGRALRLGIESQIGEAGSCCLSILDFTQVVVLDYSCADEAVAKLIQRYHGTGHDVYFIARGLGEHHREPIETVLVRHGLLLVGEVEEGRFILLGEAAALERAAWTAIELAGVAEGSAIAAAVGRTLAEVTVVLDRLVERRVVLRQPSGRFYALSGLLDRSGRCGPSESARTGQDD
ncbi:MAG: hypothetical protein ACREL7_02775 [Longimicrobiales bacterium]